MPLPEYVRDYIATQHLAFFKEVHSIEEAAEHFNQAYPTMARHVKKYSDAGHLLTVRREGNKKFFQTASDNDIPYITLNGKTYRVDMFLSQAIPLVVSKKRANLMKGQLIWDAAYYRSYLTSHLAMAIYNARLEDGDPETQLNLLREFLIQFHGHMQEKLNEIRGLLDHPTLWDVDNLIEWANNNAPITGLDATVPQLIKEHYDAIIVGPTTEVKD